MARKKEEETVEETAKTPTEKKEEKKVATVRVVRPFRLSAGREFKTDDKDFIEALEKVSPDFVIITKID